MGVCGCVCGCVCVCVCNICIDVKLLILSFSPEGYSVLFNFAGGHSISLGLCPTKLPVKWDIQLGQLDVPAFNCQCLVMGRGSTQEPQSRFYLFLHGCHNLYFAETMSPMLFLIISPRSCRRCIFGYFGNPSPKHYFLDVQHAGQTLWILVKTPLDNIGCRTSFSRSTS